MMLKPLPLSMNPRRAVWALLAAVLLSACGAQTETQRNNAPAVPGGDAERGRRALVSYGCGACHTIPGVPDADATVGPPLNDWGDRRYIAGALENEPENLIFWIQFPQQVEPGTAMPDMGVEEGDARDMTAYLFELRRDRGGLWPFTTGNR